MTKTVIFGGSGFIGTAVRSLLDKEGMEYSYPTEREINLAQTAVATQNGIDNIIENGDNIVMLAGYTNEYGHPRRLTADNVAMAANLLWGITGKDIGHFVYISSDSVYGKGDEPPFWKTITEQTPITPDSLYGYMHAMREQFFRERFAPDRLTILRPCSVYGVGDTHNAYGINSFIREAKEKGTITLFGKGEEYRPSIHVEDVAAIIVRSIKGKISGTFNINSGISITYKDIADCIQANIGKEIVITSKPRTMPVTYRHFQNAAMAQHFFMPRKTEDGIKQYLDCVKD